MNRHGNKGTRGFTENCGDIRDGCGKDGGSPDQAFVAGTEQAVVVLGRTCQATLLHLREATRLGGRGTGASSEICRQG